LWFAIGGSHVIDRSLPPHTSKHIIREEKRPCRKWGSYFDSTLRGHM